MGDVVAMISVSLDGFLEGPNQEIDWHRVDAELHQHLNDYLRGTGAFLEGRRTYQLMVEYWPTADLDPDAPPEIVDFAAIWRDKRKVVYSRTLQEAGSGATIVRDIVAEDVQALKDGIQGDLVVGGADVADEFRRLDLIDEYRIYVHPVLVGAGKRFFFPATTLTALELLEVERFGNDVVLLRYGRG
jgi:dihydrofolate reductase